VLLCPFGSSESFSTRSLKKILQKDVEQTAERAYTVIEVEDNPAGVACNARPINSGGLLRQPSVSNRGWAMERVCIFIDGSNFYHGLKAASLPTNIHFNALAQRLCAGRHLMRTYYYNVRVDQAADPQRYSAQQRFFESLRDMPYVEVKLGRLVPRGATWVEKGVDVRLAVDMLSLAFRDAYDTAILISGDGDFAAVVQAVKDLGKHVENAYFRRGRSDALLDACDHFIEVTPELIGACLV